MATISTDLKQDTLHIKLTGSIDSSNAAEVEREIAEKRSSVACSNIVLDFADLGYISSAGLRIVLRLRKEFPELSIVNVSSDVYEVLDMTGFTEMVDVRKAYRVLSVDGCEAIGRGANGKVYRIDSDTIVKVYNNPEALPEIQRERELARTAFVLGIPTAIPYDVVRVGEGYGSVFELLDAKSFAQLLSGGEKSVEEIAQMMAELLRQIHGTVVREGSMPSMRDTALGWASFLDGHLPEDTYAKLYALVEAIPEDMHMMHGDLHIKNVMYQNGEALLIDMDTLCHGNPVFELGSIYNAYQGFSLTDRNIVKKFLGVDYETCTELWQRTLSLYLGTDDPERFAEVERKAEVIGFMRLLRRAIRRNHDGDMNEKIAAYRSKLIELVDEVDTLLF
jgi:uncharacterized protein (TIGR02172 family)